MGFNGLFGEWTETPVAEVCEAWNNKDGTEYIVTVFCPHCKELHGHGHKKHFCEDGHRAADCRGDIPGKRVGYIVGAINVPIKAFPR